MTSWRTHLLLWLGPRSNPGEELCEWVIKPSADGDTTTTTTTTTPIALEFQLFDLFTDNVAYVEVYSGESSSTGQLLGACRCFAMVDTHLWNVALTLPCASVSQLQRPVQPTSCRHAQHCHDSPSGQQPSLQ